MFKRLSHLSFILFITYSELSYGDLLKNQTFNNDGEARTYDVYLHNNYKSTVSPLVVLLHGYRGDADAMTGANNKTAPYKVWQSIAEREGLILLIPDGSFSPENYRGWNDCRKDASTNPTSNDVKFINTLIEKLSLNYSINKNKIYASGTSNGGNMVFRLAQESGDKYRAVAVIAASMPAENKCIEPKAPVSVMVMNGTKDPILPYNGGAIGRRTSDKKERGSSMSTQESVNYWLRHNKITTKPKVNLKENINKRDGGSVITKHYYGGLNNSKVVLYKVEGGGHTEPSLTEHYRRIYKLIVGKQNKDIEMAEEVWTFFNSHN